MNLSTISIVAVLATPFITPLPLEDNPACVCQVIAGGAVPGGGEGEHEECAPASFAVTFGFGDASPGVCFQVTPNCEPRNCEAKIKVIVTGQGPCRFYVLKDLGIIGGGALPGGGSEWFVNSDMNVGCGDFVVFSFLYDDVVLTSETFLCQSCEASSG